MKIYVEKLWSGKVFLKKPLPPVMFLRKMSLGTCSVTSLIKAKKSYTGYNLKKWLMKNALRNENVKAWGLN